MEGHLAFEIWRNTNVRFGLKSLFVSQEAMIAAQELAGFSHSIRPAGYLSAIRCKNECCRSRHPYIHVELLAVFSRSTNYLMVQRDKNGISRTATVSQTRELFSMLRVPLSILRAVHITEQHGTI